MESSLEYQFGDFRLDLREEALFRDGDKVTINRRTFQVLRLLVERAGEIVSKQEFFDTVWADTFVEDNSLTVAVTTLRKVLGDNAKDPRFIENLPRKGYRFIAEVTATDKSPVPAATPALAPDRPQTPFRPSSIQSWARIAGAAAVTVLVVAVALAVAYLRQAPSKTDSRAERLTSVAVIPFKNDTAESEYLAQGLTESVTNSLGRIAGLRVIHTNSAAVYEGRDRDAAGVGRASGVGCVLTGQLLQRGADIAVTVRLTDIASNGVVWEKRYEAPVTNAVTIANDISRDIANVARSYDGSLVSSASKRGTNDPEAYLLYVKGQYYWNKRTGIDVNKALALFQQAIDKDPTFALAYVGLASSYAHMDLAPVPNPSPAERLALVRGAALKALEIDPDLGEAYSVLGLAEAYFGLDLKSAERDHQKGVTLSPNNATGHHWYAEVLVMQGRFDEAFHEYDLALEHDPLSFAIMTDRAMAFYYARQPERAVEELFKIKQVNPDFERTDLFLTKVYEDAGKYPEAILHARLFYDHQKKTGQLDDVQFARLSGMIDNLEHGFDRSGPDGYWRAKIDHEIVLGGETGPSAWGMAKYSAKLGETEKVFPYMNTAMDRRDGSMLWMKVAPDFDAVRNDPRFTEALQRIGLPGP